MFRVPVDPNHPTFDHTFTVTIGQWLTSRKQQRVEWMRRRNEAAGLAARHQQQRVARPAQPPHQPPAAPYPAPQQRHPDGPPPHIPITHEARTARTHRRLSTLALWLETIELGAELLWVGLLVTLVLACCGCGIWSVISR
ncbi:hypothetical protein ACGFI9_21865 [Micromonospora sp. NPDC048930]|uniref:hypothetical protein n=1 Tax=Micromonospora sp. NPDC048930 TaxID=3364261 RepID=UPI003716E6A6